MPRTLLIDSQQLESGDALAKDFRSMAAPQIEQFRRQIVERTGDRSQAEKLSDEDLLRETMNTVGKEGRLGESIRCVVSVSMLTEGWDANTVTHVLGVRAFGTQLLCEQVVGRALRRQSYDLNSQGLFDVEYADVLGVPFDFTAKPVVAPPQPPRQTIQVSAVRPERDHLEIRFPRVSGYRVELPKEELSAEFTADSVLRLTPDLVGPYHHQERGNYRRRHRSQLDPHQANLRQATLEYNLTERLLNVPSGGIPNEEPKIHLFGKAEGNCQAVARHQPAVRRRHLSGTAHVPGFGRHGLRAHRRGRSIGPTPANRPVKVLLDPFNPTGSTAHVNFTTSKESRWQTDPRKCHVNWVVLDSDWEAEFCRVAEAHPKVKAYVKNHNLGLEVPYQYGSTPQKPTCQTSSS